MQPLTKNRLKGAESPTNTNNPKFASFKHHAIGYVVKRVKQTTKLIIIYSTPMGLLACYAIRYRGLKSAAYIFHPFRVSVIVIYTTRLWRFMLYSPVNYYLNCALMGLLACSTIWYRGLKSAAYLFHPFRVRLIVIYTTRLWCFRLYLPVNYYRNGALMGLLACYAIRYRGLKSAAYVFHPFRVRLIVIYTTRLWCFRLYSPVNYYLNCALMGLLACYAIWYRGLKSTAYVFHPFRVSVIVIYTTHLRCFMLCLSINLRYKWEKRFCPNAIPHFCWVAKIAGYTAF